ncbi:uncharacterized protein LOC124132556 isoform X2 [Haliotis rufescens]|uniref:uncharacterized protein LOC124132556 isoform X2 n=1 Tax=Haliotis rufescens TaxID=6454 RepID=UPI00201FA77F|nr:uncharacterized protein LOC124132556 isoform X2 [Haliotis rufescens]XP_048248508.1 uncharacterized protein LOC124132556 isoform X2 [Haliotis rufescens]
MPTTRSGEKRSCGNTGGSNVVKTKKSQEPYQGQSRDCCPESDEEQATCKDGVSTQSTKSDLDLSEKRKSISRTIQMKHQNIQRIKASISESRKTRTRIQSEIRCVSDTIISQFRQKEKQLMDGLEGVSEKQFELLSDDVRQNETDIQSINQNNLVLKTMLGNNDWMELYPAHQKLLSGQKEDEDKFVRLIHDVSVSQDSENVKKVFDDLSFGRLDLTFQDLHDRSCRPKLLSTTNVALKKDFRQTGYAFDIIVLDVEGIRTIVVSDCLNRSVKSFYTKNNESCHSEYGVATPYDLTQLGHNQVMVSAHETFRILILAVTPDLICLSEIESMYRYVGLRGLTPSTLVGCRYDTGTVDILDRKEKEINIVKTFPSPFERDKGGYHRLCVASNGNILLANWKRKSLVCMTQQGDLLWDQSPAEDGAFIKPVAVKTTRTGDILLADGEANRVIQLTESGQYVKDVLVPEDGLASLTALHLYNERHLFVGVDGKVKEYLLP